VVAIIVATVINMSPESAVHRQIPAVSRSRRHVLLGPWMNRFRAERRDYCVRCPMPLHLTIPLRDSVA